jgi:putative ABC transport system ATP-binding protein
MSTLVTDPPPRPDGEPLLAVDDLRRSIEGRVLYDRLSFAVAPGERVAVRGPSGSGKTLLLRSLAGLEPLEAGRVALLGIDQAQWSMPAYRCRLMLLPQRPSLPEGPVDGVLAAPFSFRAHADRRYDPAAARAYLERVGRSSAFLEKETARLSGGEQQLTALLRALLLEPQILLLDEPTASLDAEAAEAVEALVAAWLERSDDRAYLWTSHDPAQLERVSSRSVALGTR